jgi:hypothetical protein
MSLTLISEVASMNSPQKNQGFQSRRSLSKILEPLDRLAAGSVHLIANHSARFQSGDESYVLPRYLFVGPKGGDEPLRIGVFAGIHGDEPEGIHALARFLTLLESQPELAAGYRIFAYPICNPTGVEDGTRNSRAGKDLNREFWRQSGEPEVHLLQSELVSHSFHGIISLHTDDTSHGFYGYARGATLTRNLIEPALSAAAEFVPLNSNDIIDGFDASSSIIHEIGFEGILSAPPKVRPRPFEIILETPQAAPEYLKETALSAALQTILARYREFISYASNI